MDDRDLEARLRTHLRRRLDDARPSRELASSVGQLFATPSRRVSLAGLRVQHSMRLGFSLTAAAAVVVVAAIAASNLGLHLGPSSIGASRSPGAVPTERTFIVLPPNALEPSKADSSLAGDVLSARLRALGVGNFSMAGGYGMTFTLLDPNRPGDDQIRAVLAAPGDVEFVPLPETDYGNGGPAAVVGSPLPKAEQALFGREGIASITESSSASGFPVLTVHLTSPAATAIATYTSARVREQLAIVIDGSVAELLTIGAPITDAAIQISTADSGAVDPAVAWAILIGGALPLDWRGVSVPTVISKDDAVARATAVTPATTIHDAELSGQLIDGAWRAVWSVALSQPACSDVGSCPNADSLLVEIDAVTGSVIEVAAPSP